MAGRLDAYPVLRLQRLGTIIVSGGRGSECRA